jgi:CBS domain-containing protein
MVTAREVMTPDVECVRASDNVLDAARKMVDFDVGSLPICGEDGKLKGMLTDRDIVVEVVAAHRDPSGVHASELAKGTPITVEADDDVTVVLRMMTLHQIRRVPVLEDKVLVGIIAQADVARAVEREQTGYVVEAVSDPDR